MKVKPYKGNENYIFMSYSHRDMREVLDMVEQFQLRGYNVWFDEGIDPGAEWDETIASHIEECTYFIAYISENYINSQNCRDELNFARDLDKDRLLVYESDIDLPSGMRMRMNRLQAIYKNKYPDPEDFYAKVFNAYGIEKCRNKAFAAEKPKPASQQAPKPAPKAAPAPSPKATGNSSYGTTSPYNTATYNAASFAGPAVGNSSNAGYTAPVSNPYAGYTAPVAQAPNPGMAVTPQVPAKANKKNNSFPIILVVLGVLSILAVIGILAENSASFGSGSGGTGTPSSTSDTEYSYGSAQGLTFEVPSSWEVYDGESWYEEEWDGNYATEYLDSDGTIFFEVSRSGYEDAEISQGDYEDGAELTRDSFAGYAKENYTLSDYEEGSTTIDGVECYWVKYRKDRSDEGETDTIHEIYVLPVDELGQITQFRFVYFADDTMDANMKIRDYIINSISLQ